MSVILTEQSSVSKFLFSNTIMAWFWLVVRIYVGWQWFEAGFEKINDPSWVGPGAGSALSGFMRGALAKTSGAHPDVTSWYAWFLQHVVAPHTLVWSNAIAFGEFFVSIALLAGALTGIAAFFGFFMNLNYLFAGTVSINPVLLVLSVGIMLAWKIAGYIGVDRFLFPRIIQPWREY